MPISKAYSTGNKPNEIVSVADFGAVGDGVTDDTAAFNAAIATGAKYITIPVPSVAYLISSTVAISTSKNITFKGIGRDSVKIITSITDGTPVFTVSGQFHDIGDFKIDSLDSVSAQNFVGIQAGNVTAATSFVRSRLRVKVSNSSATGVEVRGWINDLDILTTRCNRGYKGRENNNCVMNIRGEENTQGFDIEEIYGTTIHTLLDENTFSALTTTTPSVIDNFRGLSIGTIYLEGGSYSTNAILFAGSTQSYGLTIDQIRSSISPEDRTDAIIIDDVEGVEIAGDVSMGGFLGTVGFSNNTAGIRSAIVSRTGNSSGSNQTSIVHDNSKQIRIAQNWQGDTYLDHDFDTFDTVTKSGVTTSIETTNIITGQQGIRITASTGGATRVLILGKDVTYFPRVANLVGKTFKVFAWVYVPDLAKYADRTYQPGIEISTTGGASTFSAMQRNAKAGTWNLMETTAITPAGGWTGTGGDKFNINFYVNGNSETVVDSGYYIIVDSIYLVDSSVSTLDIQIGNIEDYNMLGVKSDGERLTVISDNYSSMTNADSSVKDGDTVLYSSVTAAGHVGEIVTTAGDIGGTAVFKTFGDITA